VQKNTCLKRKKAASLRLFSWSIDIRAAASRGSGCIDQLPAVPLM
jgi:hypothetical protein